MRRRTHPASDASKQDVTTMRARVSRGGQVTVPARVRHRWQTDRITVEDHGDHLVLRPTSDPIEAFVGFAAKADAPASETLRAQARGEERARERSRR